MAAIEPIQDYTTPIQRRTVGGAALLHRRTRPARSSKSDAPGHTTMNGKTMASRVYLVWNGWCSSPKSDVVVPTVRTPLLTFTQTHRHSLDEDDDDNDDADEVLEMAL